MMHFILHRENNKLGHSKDEKFTMD